MIFHHAPYHKTRFQFVKNGNLLVDIPASVKSIFFTYDDNLYFADYSPLAPGCKVAAYDLTDGRNLWITKELSQLRQGGASPYSNQVNMYLSRVNQVENEPAAAAIIVKGNENFGHYIAVIDRESGRLLAHKIYGTRFFRDHHVDDTNQSE